ncbi:hypothetical protein K474DRAFT_1707618 [Panus rudis PR-1116 ss-1]|nr:hypothetical protein K474DRAFT_1707618 [Panus rudis PR-1116 ss-1]
MSLLFTTIKVEHFAPADLRAISRIIANAPNLRSLSVQNDLYKYLVTIHPDLQRSFYSRPHLECLTVNMVEEESPDGEMIEYMSKWSLPSLRELHCYCSGTLKIEWNFVEPFHKLVQRLWLSDPPIDFQEWRVPCENVTELTLGNAPWEELPTHLPSLFPNAVSVVLHERGWDPELDVDDVYNGIDEEVLERIDDMREDSFRMHGKTWTHLKKLDSDLHTIYALGLRCSVDELVLQAQFSLSTARLFLAEVLQDLQPVKTLTFELHIAEISTNQTSLREMLRECDFTHATSIDLRFDLDDGFDDEDELLTLADVMCTILGDLQEKSSVISEKDKRVWAFRSAKRPRVDIYFNFKFKRVRDANEFHELAPELVEAIRWSRVIFPGEPVPTVEEAFPYYDDEEAGIIGLRCNRATRVANDM